MGEPRPNEAIVCLLCSTVLKIGGKVLYEVCPCQSRKDGFTPSLPQDDA